ncbi:MAG: hypothetical protein Alpg2KO_28250 [Alphaproteobacteria bacterium]
MFDPKPLQHLLTQHARTFKALSTIEQRLNARLAYMQEPIRALLLAVMAGEPLLLVGLPGTAKSRLIRNFCSMIGVQTDAAEYANDPDSQRRYFEYLLTPFTEPAELFGYFDVGAMQRGEGLQRLDDGMMHKADIVFLDEVFNGSSAILNAILAFMNERVFHDRGRAVPVNMKCMFAATNDIPRTGELKAVFDRFLIRAHLDNVAAEPEALSTLIEAGWSETYADQGDADAFDWLLPALEDLRGDIRRMTATGKLKLQNNGQFYARLTDMVRNVRQYELSDMSNRRLIKLIHVMLLNRLYRASLKGEGGKFTFGAPELLLIPRHALDIANRHDEADVLARLDLAARKFAEA